jgi:hypothetical protein
MKNSGKSITLGRASSAIRDAIAGTGAIRGMSVRNPRGGGDKGPPDLIVDLKADGRRHRLLVIVLPRGEPFFIERAAGTVQANAWSKKGYPVIVAPFISDRGRSLCKGLGLGFVDLAGNAVLELPGLSIERWGKENAKREGRLLRSIFSRKATRVLRKMLIDPKRRWTLQALGAEAHVSVSHAQKVVARLEQEGFVEGSWGDISLKSPGGLLDAWRARYDFRDQVAVGYYLRSSGTDEVLSALSGLGEGSYALTLGAAASLVAPFVRTTDVHAYVTGDLDEVARSLGLESVEFGGNVHLVTPYDEGVLYDTRAVRGLSVVSDVQLYLDLYNWPMRGREQAEHLRERVLGV